MYNTRKLVSRIAYDNECLYVPILSACNEEEGVLALLSEVSLCCRKSRYASSGYIILHGHQLYNGELPEFEKNRKLNNLWGTLSWDITYILHL